MNSSNAKRQSRSPKSSEGEREYPESIQNDKTMLTAKKGGTLFVNNQKGHFK